MERKTYKGKISQKGFSPFSYKKISKSDLKGPFFSTGSGKNEGVAGKESKVFKVSNERSRRTDAVTGHCNISNFKEILNRFSNRSSELTEHINEFLVEMLKIIREEEGGMNKFSENGFYFFFPVRKTEITAENKVINTAFKMRSQMNKLNRKWGFFWDESWSLGIGISKGYISIANYDDKLERSQVLEDDTSNLSKYLSRYISNGQIVINEKFYESHDFKDKDIVITPFRHLALRETGKTIKIYEIIGQKSTYSK
jgi:class 3 adenylate cyclase